MVTERILIAEADPRTKEVLVIKLSNAGYRVHAVDKGDEVVEKALSLEVDIILLALNLPGKDGMEICYELRQIPQTRRTPVITILEEDRDLMELAEMGVRFDDKLLRPFHPKDALLKVHALLAQRRSLMGVNRITGLPDKQQFDLELKERLELEAKFNLLYVDIEDFTIYNKYYGFEQGDEVIKAVGIIISEVISGLDTTDVFLSHIGADNFRIILPLNYGEQVGKEIITRFDQKIPEFYLEHDRVRGGIVVKNRIGILQQWPIMSIAVAQISNEYRTFNHPLEFDMVAQELLQFAKTKPGSNFVYDRRRNIQTEQRVEEP
jgi:diguanylate cyclase (GGDEF)-like protein